MRSPDAAALAAALEGMGALVTRDGDGALSVDGVDAERVGDLCRDRGWALHELAPSVERLEDVFLRLVEEAA